MKTAKYNVKHCKLKIKFTPQIATSCNAFASRAQSPRSASRCHCCTTGPKPQRATRESLPSWGIINMPFLCLYFPLFYHLWRITKTHRQETGVKRKEKIKKNWSSPSIFYNLYMLGNRPSTCSYYSCRRPNISVMHPFPDKRGGGEKKKRVRSGLKRAGVRYQTKRGRVCSARLLGCMGLYLDSLLSGNSYPFGSAKRLTKVALELNLFNHSTNPIQSICRGEKALVNKRGHWIKTLQTPDDPTWAKHTRQDYDSDIKWAGNFRTVTF